jgi:hypothetical protein
LQYFMTHDLAPFRRGLHALLMLGAAVMPTAAQSTTAGTAVAGTPSVTIETPVPADVSNGKDAEFGERYLKGRFLVGVTWGPVWTVDSKLGDAYKVSPFVRWNSTRSGWGPTFGINWVTTGLGAPVGGQASSIGTLKLRPVMAGLAYNRLSARVRVSAGIVAGYTFNDARTDVPLPPGVTATVKVANTWAVGPKAGITFAVTRRLGLVGSLSYVYSNPNVTVRVSRGGVPVFEATDHVRGDALTARIGMAVSLF